MKIGWLIPSQAGESATYCRIMSTALRAVGCDVTILRPRLFWRRPPRSLDGLRLLITSRVVDPEICALHDACIVNIDVARGSNVAVDLQPIERRFVVLHDGIDAELCAQAIGVAVFDERSVAEAAAACPGEVTRLLPLSALFSGDASQIVSHAEALRDALRRAIEKSPRALAVGSARRVMAEMGMQPGDDVAWRQRIEQKIHDIFPD